MGAKKKRRKFFSFNSIQNFIFKIKMRQSNRGRAQNLLARRLGHLKRELHGHENKLNHLAPPSFSKRPFNNLVVSHVLVNAGIEDYIGPTDIITYLANQLGLQAQTKNQIVFKIRRIDFYAVPIGSSDDRPSINMEVSSLIPVLADPATPGSAQVSYGNLFRKGDIGSLQDCAKLSYTFPKAMSDIPLASTADFNFLTVSSNQRNSELRFHLSWSTIGEATPVA